MHSLPSRHYPQEPQSWARHGSPITPSAPYNHTARRNTGTIGNIGNHSGNTARILIRVRALATIMRAPEKIATHAINISTATVPAISSAKNRQHFRQESQPIVLRHQRAHSHPIPARAISRQLAFRLWPPARLHCAQRQVTANWLPVACRAPATGHRRRFSPPGRSPAILPAKIGNNSGNISGNNSGNISGNATRILTIIRGLASITHPRKNQRSRHPFHHSHRAGNISSNKSATFPAIPSAIISPGGSHSSSETWLGQRPASTLGWHESKTKNKRQKTQTQAHLDLDITNRSVFLVQTPANFRHPPRPIPVPVGGLRSGTQAAFRRDFNRPLPTGSPVAGDSQQQFQQDLQQDLAALSVPTGHRISPSVARSAWISSFSPVAKNILGVRKRQSWLDCKAISHSPMGFWRAYKQAYAATGRVRSAHW